MGPDRQLHWDGGHNIRDLGGLPTISGRTTRWGAVVRSGLVDRLTGAGWAALLDHGVRTVVDLRNDDEVGAAVRHPDVTTVHLPLDGVEDTEFWDYWGAGRHGTPLYYRPFLDRFPARTAAVVRAVATARPGGVLIHCGAGRDRTGIITMLLLAAAGVGAADIAADHDLSARHVPRLLAATGRPDDAPLVARALAAAGTTAAEVITSFLATFDADAYLRSGGLTAQDVATLRTRLLTS